MADAPALGAGGGNPVEVRTLSPAPKKDTGIAGVFCLWASGRLIKPYIGSSSLKCPQWIDLETGSHEITARQGSRDRGLSHLPMSVADIFRYSRPHVQARCKKF